jgi:hypothetical protein
MREQVEVLVLLRQLTDAGFFVRKASISGPPALIARQPRIGVHADQITVGAKGFDKRFASNPRFEC